MRKFNISTDALTTTMHALNEDDAAVKFAAAEGYDKGREINDLEDLQEAASDMGGWVKIHEA